MERFISAFAIRSEDSKNWSMVTTQHRKMMDRRSGISRTPFDIGKGTIEALKRWSGAKSFVGLGVSRSAVPQVNEITLLDMITKGINTSKVRLTQS
jgi:hypothetical protein